MVGYAAGLCGATVIYLGASHTALRTQQAAIRAAPAEWRDHPELREQYAQILAARGWSSLRGFQTGSAWIRLAAATIVAFGGIGLLDFDVWFALVYSAALALWWACAGYVYGRDEAARFAREHDLPRSGRGRRFWLAYSAASFCAWLGFLAAATFVGALVAELIL